MFTLRQFLVLNLYFSFAFIVTVTKFTLHDKLHKWSLKDAYTLKFFENNSSCLPKWCNDADTVKLPFCQIRGKYRMELPGYNTMEPYPHMNERCPSLPPKYSRPKGC
ncbi:hypothetical protein HYC85_024030 [Camellia sinensis]|uniref:Uncharacterized protein n=1 Tax=Camellia sinensis TaxID=4442 RepID=A0A7J7GIL4_CAMSI|nr:hypothetical protein HYC85_024030 [Camellia sinensis]